MVVPVIIAGIPAAGYGMFKCWHTAYQHSVANHCYGKEPKSTGGGTAGAVCEQSTVI